MKIKHLLPLLTLALQACAQALEPEPIPDPVSITHYVMHSASSTDKNQTCFDITETVRALALIDDQGNVSHIPEITTSYFKTACNPNARPYRPLQVRSQESLVDSGAPEQ